MFFNVKQTIDYLFMLIIHFYDFLFIVYAKIKYRNKKIILYTFQKLHKYSDIIKYLI